MVALVPQQETVVTLVSRTGRHLQRYVKGRRQVVGLVFLSFSTSLLILRILVVFRAPINQLTRKRNCLYILPTNEAVEMNFSLCLLSF